MHYLLVQNELVYYENEGLKEAIGVKKKRKKHGKVLEPEQGEDYHGGAVFWSPKKVREARERRETREANEEADKVAKADAKQLRETEKILKKKLAEDKRVEREKAKVVREKERAKKDAEKQRKKQAKLNTKKPFQPSQSGKRKALSKPSTKNKRQKPSTVDAAPDEVVPAAETRKSTRGRTLKPKVHFEEK